MTNGFLLEIDSLFCEETKTLLHRGNLSFPLKFIQIQGLCHFLSCGFALIILSTALLEACKNILPKEVTNDSP